MVEALLDTHIWLWYLHRHRELPSSLKERIDAAPDDVWLSPISVWEVGLLHERGRFDLGMSLRDWLADVRRHLPTRWAPITDEVAAVYHEIDLAHRDPADRFLAATGLVYDLPLMTADRRLIDAEWLPTISG